MAGQALRPRLESAELGGAFPLTGSLRSPHRYATDLLLSRRVADLSISGGARPPIFSHARSARAAAAPPETAAPSARLPSAPASRRPSGISGRGPCPPAP